MIPPLLVRRDVLAILHDLMVLEIRRRNVVSLFYRWRSSDADVYRPSLRKLLEHMQTDHALAPRSFSDCAAAAAKRRERGDVRGAAIWSRTASRMQAEWERMKPLMETLS